MFSAAVSNLVKEFGRDTLIPTSSLDQSQNIQLFNVVIKHKRQHFWQSKCRLEPLPFILSVLLKDLEDKSPPLVLQSLVRQRDLGQYTFQVSTNMKGKLGIELLRESCTVDTGDEVVKDFNFSKLEKLYVTEYELMKALEKRVINLDNDIVKKIRKKSHEVLCMITGVIHPLENVKIVKNSTLSEDGKIKAQVEKEILDIDAEEDGSKKKSEGLEIPPKTNLAYNYVELKIRPDGTIGVCLTQDDKGGFDVIDTTDNGTEKSLFYPPIEVTRAKNKKELQEALVECVNYPTVLEWLVHLLHVIHSHGEEKEAWNDKLWKFVGDDGFQAARRFLKLINVEFEYGGAIDANEVDKEMLGCVLFYLEMMSFLSNDEITAIKYCAQKPYLIPAFLKVFQDTLLRKDIEKDSVVPLLEYDWALNLLFCLGYDLSKVEKTDTVLPPKESYKVIEACGKILYGLFILPIESE